MKPKGICPVCNGTKRQAVPALSRESIIRWNKTYDAATDTMNCQNCVPKGMFASQIPTGESSLNKDGEPCTHEFVEQTISNCYYRYTCKHCNDSFTIDSGD